MIIFKMLFKKPCFTVYLMLSELYSSEYYVLIVHSCVLSAHSNDIFQRVPLLSNYPLGNKQARGGLLLATAPRMATLAADTATPRGEQQPATTRRAIGSSANSVHWSIVPTGTEKSSAWYYLCARDRKGGRTGKMRSDSVIMCSC